MNPCDGPHLIDGVRKALEPLTALGAITRVQSSGGTSFAGSLPVSFVYVQVSDNVTGRVDIDRLLEQAGIDRRCVSVVFGAAATD